MISTALSQWGTRPIAAAIVAVWATTAAAQQFDEQFSHWPVDLKINGKILVDNDVQDWDPLRPVLDRIARNRSVRCFHRGTATNPLAEALKKAVGEDGSFEETPFTALPHDEVKEALSSAGVVVLQTADGDSADRSALLKLQPHFDRFLAKGGTLVVDKAAAPCVGKFVVSLSDAPLPKGAPGLNLFPDSLLLCDSGTEEASRDELLKAVARHPRTVGIVLEQDSLLMLSGRKVTCHGTGRATFLLAGCDHAPPRIESISSARSPGRPLHESLLDLTEWRRDAIDRTLEPFPPAEPETPFVENGTLVIVGGGGMPAGLMDRFVELAGGIENARLVYVPCSEDADASRDQGTVPLWKRMGVRFATSIHTKDRRQANSDDTFLEPLKEATGIWFGGGRQWNLADSYYGTRAHQMMKAVLHRGGVIGGSSAGASIQARYLARATPIGNTRIMAPGYERGGLGFISGVAIDQHFSQRNRQKDMTQLMARHPQLLGIGLDEATAIIVQKSTANVVGRGRAFFYDRRRATPPEGPDFLALPDGTSYDLAKRTVLESAPESPATAPVTESPR